MNINNNVQANSIYQIQTTTSNVLKISGDKIQNKTTTDTVNISSAGLNANSNWQKIANNYDVTNISQNEMASMVTSLTDNKLISSTDGLYLMAPRSMNLNPDVKFDLLATTQKALAFEKGNGGSAEGIKNEERAINILKRLQELFRKGPVNSFV